MTINKPSSILLKLLPIAMVMLAVATAYLMISAKPEIKPRPPTPAAPLVEVMIVKRESAQALVYSQGTIEASRKTKIVSEVSGRITWVSEKFKNGVMVSKNDALLRIEALDFQAALAVTKADLRNAELNLMEEEIRSKQALADWKLARKFNPKATKHATALTMREPHLASAVAAVEASNARVALATKNLQRTHITAAFNGIIEGKSVELGQYITLGSPLATLLSTDEAEVRLPLSEEDFNKLQDDGLGIAVTISTTNRLHPSSWSARVSRVEKNRDPSTRLRYAVATLQDPYNTNKKHPRSLPLGTFVNAAIKGRQYEGVFRVPQNALHENNLLFIVDASETLHTRSVEVIRLDGTHLIVSSGLNDDEKIVLTRLPIMTKNMKVRISTKSITPQEGH